MNTESMQTQKILLSDEAATLNFGKKISKYLRPGNILSLIGELGAGKTTMVRGIISGFDAKISDVTSPTFTLVHEFPTAKVKIYHCDFYRFKSEVELEDLGGLEFFSEPAIYLVEWLDRCPKAKKTLGNQIAVLKMQIIEGGRLCEIPKAWKI